MPEAPASRFARFYTVALFAFALLAVVVAWVEVGVIGELEEQGLGFWAAVVRVDQVVAMVLAPLSLVTVAARVRGWRIANLSTRIVSIALAIVFPIGTALFVYWLLRVREEEARRARDE